MLWPREPGQPSDLWERFVVERKSLTWTVEEGMKQTLRYMEQCGAEEGHLVVMDRRSGAKEHQRSEGAAEPRNGAGKAERGGRRQDGRGVVVWML